MRWRENRRGSGRCCACWTKWLPTVTARIVTLNSVNTAIPGSYAVTYRVTDTSEHRAEQVNRTVNVVGTIPLGAAQYVTVTDDSGALTVEIPPAWGDINGQQVFNDGVGDRLMASLDIDGWWAWTEPGVYFFASSNASWIGISQMQDHLSSERESASCDEFFRSDYNDGLYQGSMDTYSSCPGGASFTMITVSPGSIGDLLVILAVQTFSDADVEASDHIFSTFMVDPILVP